MEICPFNGNHHIKSIRFQKHLEKCLLMHGGKGYTRCVFNHAHVLKIEDKIKHLSECRDVDEQFCKMLTKIAQRQTQQCLPISNKTSKRQEEGYVESETKKIYLKVKDWLISTSDTFNDVVNESSINMNKDKCSFAECFSNSVAEKVMQRKLKKKTSYITRERQNTKTDNETPVEEIKLLKRANSGISSKFYNANGYYRAKSFLNQLPPRRIGADSTELSNSQVSTVIDSDASVSMYSCNSVLDRNSNISNAMLKRYLNDSTHTKNQDQNLLPRNLYKQSTAEEHNWFKTEEDIIGPDDSASNIGILEESSPNINDYSVSNVSFATTTKSQNPISFLKNLVKATIDHKSACNVGNNDCESTPSDNSIDSSISDQMEKTKLYRQMFDHWLRSPDSSLSSKNQSSMRSVAVQTEGMCHCRTAIN